MATGSCTSIGNRLGGTTLGFVVSDLDGHLRDIPDSGEDRFQLAGEAAHIELLQRGLRMALTARIDLRSEVPQPVLEEPLRRASPVSSGTLGSDGRTAGDSVGSRTTVDGAL